MSTDTLQQIDVNDAEKSVEQAERRMEDVALIPTRTARLLLKFAVIGQSPAEVEELERRGRRGGRAGPARRGGQRESTARRQARIGREADC
jgi:hypothetical protein